MAQIATIYTIANFINKGMTFLTTSIFTRLMTKDDYGKFSNIASWTSILMVIATVDLYGSIARAKYDFHEEIDEYLSSSILLGNIVTSILYIVVECNMAFFERMFSIESIYIRFIFLYLMFWPAIQFLQKKSQMYNEYKSVVAISFMSLLSSTVVSVGLMWMLENKLLARVIGNYVVAAMIGIILWGYILVRGKSFSKKHCIYALKLSLPLIPHTLAGTLLISSDRIIINKLCGAEDAALYSLAYTIAMITSVLLHSLNQAWTPWLFDKMHEYKYQVISKASGMYIGVFSIFAVGLMLIGPEVVLFFGGREYYEARFVVAPVIMAVVLQFVYTLYANIEFYCKKVYWISFGTLLATFVNIILNYIFIPKWGYIAAAYTTICGYMCMVIFHYLTAAWKCRSYINIYNKKLVALSIALLSGMMAVSLFLYQYILIRYAVILIYLCFLGYITYRKREEIRKLIKS